MDKKKLAIVAIVAAIVVAAILTFRKQIMSGLTTLAGKLKLPAPGEPADTGSLVAGEITVQASNPQDAYPRDWKIFNVSPGSYQGNGQYSGGTPVTEIIQNAGGDWTPTLAAGNYWLVIGQSGGPTYGTYSGTLTDSAGKKLTFSGLDVSKSYKFTVV